MTQRHRRNPDEVTRDRLMTKLRKQESELAGLEHATADIEALWQKTKEEAEQTRRALRELGMAPPPGFEVIPVPGVIDPTPENLAAVGIHRIPDETPAPAQDRPPDDQPVGPLLPPSTYPWEPDSPPHPHRQLSDGTLEEVTP